MGTKKVEPTAKDLPALYECAKLLRRYYENDWLFVELPHSKLEQIDKLTARALIRAGLLPPRWLTE